MSTSPSSSTNKAVSKYALEAEDELENRNYVKSLLFSSSSSPSTNNNNNNLSQPKITSQPSSASSSKLNFKSSPLPKDKDKDKDKESPFQFSQVSFNVSLNNSNNNNNKEDSLDKLTKSYLAKNAVEISNIGEDLLVDKSFVFQDEQVIAEKETTALPQRPQIPSDDIQEEPQLASGPETSGDDDLDEDFKLFARNENYKEKYITKASQKQAHQGVQGGGGGFDSRDDSLYDVISIGNQTPFKNETLTPFEDNLVHFDMQHKSGQSTRFS